MTEVLDHACQVCGTKFAERIVHIGHREVPLCDRCDPKQYEMRVNAERKRPVPRSVYP